MIALPKRRLQAIAAISAAPAAYSLVGTVCSSSISPLNACRLAQIVGMAHHYPLYPDPTHGVMSPWTFGPVPALLFLFSSIISRPTSQLLAVTCLNACIVLGSALWLSLRLAGKENRAIGWLAFLVALWCVLTHDSLIQIAFAVTPDGPMIGFATCAVAVLANSRGRPQLALAAIAMVLAIWCKASAFPILIVIPAYLLLAGQDRQTVAWYGGLSIIAALIISAAFFALFGVSNMWNFMVTLPLNQPWLNAQMNVITDGKLVELATVLLAFLHDLIPTIALIAAALLLGRFLSNPQQYNSPGLPEWLIFPAMALLLAPAAELGYLKMGRSAEAFGSVHFFLVMAAVAALISVYRRCSQNSARLVLIACVCVYSIWQAAAVMLTWHRAANLYRTIQNTYANSNEAVYAFAREHPGEVFFPWNTLSTLQAEGKLYHSETGFNLYYRAHPNEPIDPDRIHQYTPERIRFIAFPPQHESERIRQVFQQASQRATIAELPGFVAYTQPAKP